MWVSVVAFPADNCAEKSGGRLPSRNHQTKPSDPMRRVEISLVKYAEEFEALLKRSGY